jgi:DNA topoisomerase VI subunit B
MSIYTVEMMVRGYHVYQPFGKLLHMRQNMPAICYVPHPKKFAGKTFVALHKSTKVFSLESFLLYSMCSISNVSLQALVASIN